MQIHDVDYLQALQRIKQSYQASPRMNTIRNGRERINRPLLQQELITIARRKAVEYE